MGYCGGLPVEDMQSLTIASLSAADVAKQYEHIRELGKGTYGKVDLVAHRTQGESSRRPRQLNTLMHLFILQVNWENKLELVREKMVCARPRALSELEIVVRKWSKGVAREAEGAVKISLTYSAAVIINSWL